jgi:hypothetical protein
VEAIPHAYATARIFQIDALQLSGAFAVLAAGMYRYNVAGDTPSRSAVPTEHNS